MRNLLCIVSLTKNLFCDCTLCIKHFTIPVTTFVGVMRRSHIRSFAKNFGSELTSKRDVVENFATRRLLGLKCSLMCCRIWKNLVYLYTLYVISF